MRHDCRSQNPDAHIEHILVLENFQGGNESQEHARQTWLGEKQLRNKTYSNRGNQRDHQGLDVAKALVLEIEDGKHIQTGDDASPDQRDSEKQLQPDRGPDHFRKITSCDRQLAKNPQEQDDRLRVMIATRLRKIPPSGDPKLDAKMLE